MTENSTHGFLKQGCVPSAHLFRRLRSILSRDTDQRFQTFSEYYTVKAIKTPCFRVELLYDSVFS